MKQLGLLFLLMSSHNTLDYIAVFQELNHILSSSPKVSLMVPDFKLSLRKAIKEVFPDVTSCGCVLHWTQSLWSKILGVSQQSNYMQDASVHNLCKLSSY